MQGNYADFVLSVAAHSMRTCAQICSPPRACWLPWGNTAPYAHAHTQAQAHTYTAAHYAQYGKKIQKTGSCKRLKDVLRIHRVVSLDSESQRNGKKKRRKKEKRISEMWQYSNIRYTNTKTIALSSKEFPLWKDRSECYCNDKETTETKHSGYSSPMVLRFPLFWFTKKKKKNQICVNSCRPL